MFRHLGCALSALAVLLLLSGCGDDGPAYNAAPRRVISTPRMASVPSGGLLEAPEVSHAASDPLITPDALAGPVSPGADVAPLSPNAVNAAPAVHYDDPLAETPDTLAGPAPGRAMPTEHSHWLKGNIFNARVTARLNGLYLGTYSAPQDRDITMKLRTGMNTLTLTYQPLSSTASAHLDILESEHNPPIPPLATFRSPALQTAQTTIAPATTQTLTFLAR